MMKRKKDVFEEILKDFERRMEEVMQTLEEPAKVKKQAFSIKIQQGENGPEVYVQRFDGKRKETQHLKLEPAEIKEAPKRKVKKFIEPMTKIVKKGNVIIFEVAIPGVKRGDIEVTQLKRSLEIRAYASNFGYFTIFAVPKGYQIVKDELDAGKYRIYLQA